MEVQPYSELTQEQRQSFTDLKKRISGAHNTNPFAERLREVIVAFATISGFRPYLGVIKSESGGLWIRSIFFGEFLGLRPNSINKKGTQQLKTRLSRIEGPQIHDTFQPFQLFQRFQRFQQSHPSCHYFHSFFVCSSYSGI
jgi:hypothetical protein